MKNLLFVALVIFGFSASSFAQNPSATATASGTVAIGSSLTKITDLQFGTITYTAGTAGYVIMAASSALTPSSVSNVIVSGSPTAAKFTATGTTDGDYDVTIGALPAFATEPGGDQMILSNWSNDLVAGKVTITGGSGTFYIGARADIAVDQAPGLYTSASFTVTLNYN